MKLFQRLREDILLVFQRDPAARGWLEVLVCYPGLHAVWLHRLAHGIWRGGFHFPARLLSHLNRYWTGVEIHPGARIGRRLFIDHGMGIVIGETTEIGDDVLMYQGAVLGGTSTRKEKRHPTVGDRVTIGAHAAVLGPVRVADDVMIGAGSVVITDVPPGATVVGVPGRVQKQVVEGRPVLDLEHGRLEDPLNEVVKMILSLQSALEERLTDLEQSHGIRSAPLLRSDDPEGEA